MSIIPILQLEELSSMWLTKWSWATESNGTAVPRSRAFQTSSAELLTTGCGAHTRQGCHSLVQSLRPAARALLPLHPLRAAGSLPGPCHLSLPHTVQHTLKLNSDHTGVPTTHGFYSGPSINTANQWTMLVMNKHTGRKIYGLMRGLGSQLKWTLATENTLFFNMLSSIYFLTERCATE